MCCVAPKVSGYIAKVLVGDNEQEVFLGRELSRHREVSERTAQLVDAEVTRLLNDSYGRAKQTLIDNRDLLERMAEALLERETLTADDAALLVQGTALPPRKTGTTPAIPVPIPGVVVQPKPTRPGLLGGPEVAPA